MTDDKRTSIAHRVRIARGHLDKVLEMIEADQYCIDILNQSQAVQAALKEADAKILEKHLQHCVVEAIKGDKKDMAIEEVMKVFRKK